MHMPVHDGVISVGPRRETEENLLLFLTRQKKADSSLRPE
jgi:hypothetical protein